MELTNINLVETENRINKISSTDDDPVCWRCGEPDSEHQWYGGKTYCDSAWIEDEFRENFDGTKTFQPDPPQMSDEELIRRMTFIQDVRDWML